MSRTHDAAAAVRRGVDNVEAGIHKGVDKVERGLARVGEDASSALHRGVQRVDQYTTALDNYILAQATRLRNDISPLLPTISTTGLIFAGSLPLSFYFNSLSIKRVVGVQDYGFPTNLVPISLLRFIIDSVRVAAASPMLNAYFYTNPRLGLGIRWAVYTLLQPISFACNTIAVKMLSNKTPVTANEVYQSTLGREGYGGLMHGIFSQITREVILRPLIFAGATSLILKTLKWDDTLGRIPATVVIHAITAFLTYPLVYNKRKMQQKTHTGVDSAVDMIRNEWEQLRSTAATDVTQLWTGFGHHFLSILPSLALMGAAETMALRFIDHYYTIPAENQYLWPRILYRVWTLL